MEWQNIRLWELNPLAELLNYLKPYLKLKQKQAKVALEVLNLMPGSGRKMEPKTLFKLAKETDKFADLNYSKKRTNTSRVVELFLKSRHLL